MTEIFKCTSTEPYLRHRYEVITNNNKKIAFEYWEDVQVYWSVFAENIKTVIVKDKQQGFSK